MLESLQLSVCLILSRRYLLNCSTIFNQTLYGGVPWGDVSCRKIRSLPRANPERGGGGNPGVMDHPLFISLFLGEGTVVEKVYHCWITGSFLFSFSLYCNQVHDYSFWRDYYSCIFMTPEGRPGMFDVSPLSGISGLSFDSTLLSPLVLLPSPVTLSVLSFLPAGPFF